MSLATPDIIRYSNRYKFAGNPLAKSVSPTGVVFGPLAPGRWILHSKITCYWKRGDSTITAGDVLVDESTPSTSMPMLADAFIPIDVVDSTDNYVAMKSKSGGSTGLAWAMPQAPTEGY